MQTSPDALQNATGPAPQKRGTRKQRYVPNSNRPVRLRVKLSRRMEVVIEAYWDQWFADLYPWPSPTVSNAVRTRLIAYKLDDDRARIARRRKCESYFNLLSIGVGDLFSALKLSDKLRAAENRARKYFYDLNPTQHIRHGLCFAWWDKYYRPNGSWRKA